MPNRLVDETSPYLLQHADNPVDWYPWGPEALERARRESKPILLSIGYAACHWCHVMAHESFEDETTAALMNEYFVNIKVDREERPDLDGIYMQAVVAMTRSGGWPMTVFLTPETEPFFGGTYFPPTPRYGMPSFNQVLASVINAWQNRRSELVAGAREIAEHLSQELALTGEPGSLDQALFSQATQTLRARFDGVHGGFGAAPKFPQPMIIEFLLAEHARTGNEDALHMAAYTLDRMARGGMCDQIGGGFARYSTDDRWLVPHFEKMLYDNALLARVYLHAFLLTGSSFYREVTEETLDYVLREMRHADGGFFSSQDADSEGEEGKYYVWEAAELRELLGNDADLVMRYYNASERGNWEGKNILHVTRDLAAVAREVHLSPAEAADRLQNARALLYGQRTKRVWPGLDDKVLTAWNGLMLAAFAEAGAALGREDYVAAAVANAHFLRQTLRSQDGRLWRTWRAGASAKGNGYLEDYAYLANGLLALYMATFDEQWFDWVLELGRLMLIHFRDEAQGGFFDTSDDHESLIQRPKDVQDNAVPSGNAMAASVLLRLSLYTGDGAWWDLAEPAIAAMSRAMGQYPAGFAHWLTAAQFCRANPQEVALVGDLGASETAALLEAVRKPYRPHLVVALRQPGAPTGIPLLTDRQPVEGKAAAYVCRQFVCRLPVTDAEALRDQLA